MTHSLARSIMSFGKEDVFNSLPDRASEFLDLLAPCGI